MGWRNVGEKGNEILVGDGGFDAVDEMLREMTGMYQQDLNRKPTLEEILTTIEMVLKAVGDQHLSGCEELEIVEIKAKTRRRAKKQRFQVGDFFTVPLETGAFGFGRVLQLSGGTILGFYDFASATVEPASRLSQLPYLFIILCMDDGIESWRWKVVGFASLRPDEYEEPEFGLFDQVDPTKAQIYSRGKYRKATPAEARQLEEFIIWPPEMVEERLTKELKAKGRINLP
jgi:hypothetical protein